MPIQFMTVSGPQPIPEEVVAAGAEAVEDYIAAQGWQAPPPAPVADAPGADVTPDEEEG